MSLLEKSTLGSPGSSDLLQYVSVKVHVVQDYLIGALVGVGQVAALLLNLTNEYQPYS